MEVTNNISLSELGAVFKYEDTEGHVIIQKNTYKFKQVNQDKYFNESLTFYFKDLGNNVYKLVKPFYSREAQDVFRFIGTLIEEADGLLVGVR